MNLRQLIPRFAPAWALLSSGLVACQPAQPPSAETRSFYLGFTPFPYEASLQAVDYTYQTIAREADLICHSFDEGVPWPEALSGQPFSQHVQNDLNSRKARTPAGHRVFVQVTPLNFGRNGLALYRGTANEQPLPAPWATARFNNDLVKRAYLNYCERMIQHFQPHFFGFSIEANLLLGNAPKLWPDYLELHQFVYQELKKKFPQLTLLFSWHAGYLLRGYENRQDYDAQEAAVRVLNDYTDVFGVSAYLYATNFGTASLPPDFFARLRALTGRLPLAMTETGYLAQTLELDVPARITVPSDEGKQRAYFEWALAGANEYNFLFFNNFVLRDYDQLWQQIGGVRDITALWRDTGLFDETGRERPALQIWRQYLQRAKR
jgi:hypothetical protein